MQNLFIEKTANLLSVREWADIIAAAILNLSVLSTREYECIILHPELMNK